MATIINADTSDGLKLTSDTSGQIDLQSAGSTKATIDTSGNLKFNSGYGSVVTAYGCRAWVNFNGTGTVAIRDSGNVSSITDNGVGYYRVNFTTAMPDVNYSALTGGAGPTDNHGVMQVQSSSVLTTSVVIQSGVTGGYNSQDNPHVFFAIVR
jgi:hypothetical protein